MAVNASLNLGKWEQAHEWLAKVDSSNENHSFWAAMLALKYEEYDEA